MKQLNKILIALTLLSPSAHADFFKDTFDWVVDNPEYGIPAAIIGAPVALAATPMIVSYALFPFASGASYLMPELSTELAGATSQAGFAEIDGVGSTVTRTIFSQSERLAQRATYEAARSENVFTSRALSRMLLEL